MQKHIEIITPIAKRENSLRLKRVAAYVRVSDGKEAMLHSLSAQVSHYSQLIQRTPGWSYAGVYVDDPVSGTKQERPEFQRMLQDCRAGLVDIVLTKSISRFARNTVTLLETVRELKSLGIEVRFERENINSLSGDGELMLSILASFAQAESLSASENCKWRIRNGFKDGRPTGTAIFGFRMADGEFVIEPEEAEVVRMIFADYLSGMGKCSIMKKLISQCIPTRCGGQWTENSIHRILTNEKYIGDILLQKTMRPNHLTKKQLPNKGELPQYYAENSHPAIIDRDTFDAAQRELNRRSEHRPSWKASEPYPFSGRIVCGYCGRNYTRKTTHAGTKYAQAVWICPTFNKQGRTVCPSQQIPEDILLEIVDAGFEKIRITEPHTLVVVMPDDTEHTHQWQHKSRCDSWTAKMRESARNRMLSNQRRISNANDN